MHDLGCKLGIIIRGSHDMKKASQMRRLFVAFKGVDVLEKGTP